MTRSIASIPVGAFAALALVLSSAVASGERRGEPCCPEYDVANESTVEGVVEKIETRHSQGGNASIHLVVRSGETLYDVHVGPKQYYKKQGIELSERDSITMFVAPVMGGRPAAGAPLEVVARQITRGGDILLLRETNGAPLWRRAAS